MEIIKKLILYYGCVMLFLSSTHLLADFELKNSTCKATFDSNGCLKELSNNSGKTLLKNSSGWLAVLTDGTNYSWRNCPLQKSSKTDNVLTFLYKNDHLEVTLKIILRTDKLIYKPSVISKKAPVKSFAAPNRLVFDVNKNESVVMTGMVGTEMRSTFFKPLFLENSPLTQKKKIGEAAINEFNSEVKIAYKGTTPVTITQPEAGRKWLGETVKIYEKAPVPRPSIDKDHIPLFSAPEGTFVATYPMGKGYYIRFASQPRGYGEAYFYHKIIRSILKKLINEKKGKEINIGQVCQTLGIRGQDVCRNHLHRDTKSLEQEVGKTINVKALRYWPVISDALKKPKTIPVIVNYFFEGIPCKSAKDWPQAVYEIKKYIKDGGVWIDFTGGYPFFYAYHPSKWNNAMTAHYPDGGNGFSDFVYRKAGADSFALYGVQPIIDPRISRPLDDPAKYPMKVCLEVAPFKDGQASYKRLIECWSTVNKPFNFPEFVVKIGDSLQNAYLQYGKENNIFRKLTDKVPAQLLEKWKRSLFLKINDKSNKIASWTSFVETLKTPGPILFHHADWAHVNGRFDEYYPDYFPYDPKFGNKNNLKTFYSMVHKKGHLVMPYTQPIFWDANLKHMDNRPLCIKAMEKKNIKDTSPAAIKTFLESLTANRQNGKPWGWPPNLIHISPWTDTFMWINKNNYIEFTQKLGADLFFHDSVGAEFYKLDFGPHAPYPSAFLYGLLAMANEHRSFGKAPLATEGGGDQFVNYYSMFCGMIQYITPTSWTVFSTYTERYGRGTVRAFPFSLFLIHDKVMMMGHNLGISVNNREMLTWYVVLGYQLQRSNDLTALKNDIKDKSSWTLQLSALQNTLGPLISGQPMTDCQYLAENVLMTVFDKSTKVIGNLQSKPYEYDSSTTIAPWGFLVLHNGARVAGIVMEKGKDKWFLIQNGRNKVFTPHSLYDCWQPHIDTELIEQGTPVDDGKKIKSNRKLAFPKDVWEPVALYHFDNNLENSVANRSGKKCGDSKFMRSKQVGTAAIKTMYSGRVTSFVALPEGSDIDKTKEWTISFWLNVPNFSKWRDALSFGDGKFRLEVDNNNKWVLYDSGYQSGKMDLNIPVEKNTWVFFCICSDNDKITVYTGKPGTSLSKKFEKAVGLQNGLKGGITTTLGARSTKGNQKLFCIFDELAIWDRNLTIAQIQKVFSAGVNNKNMLLQTRK